MGDMEDREVIGRRWQLSAQRQQLELERQQFLQQQRTRQESWQAERKQLFQAQKKLHEVRTWWEMGEREVVSG
ncbi:hypothetical protein JYU34_018386 [Plutella xylostella]|uniref:Uncharacterized protein n=1 Tax=Plutella xylostella TaxID=51655 RepID=A0ABQ7PXF5_PLUXY|nr:hypothetical protein JYU34_018386 [Plutella xylostella]